MCLAVCSPDGQTCPATVCPLLTSCDTCTAVSQCGWCPQTSTCSYGTAFGSLTTTSRCAVGSTNGYETLHSSLLCPPLEYCTSMRRPLRIALARVLYALFRLTSVLGCTDPVAVYHHSPRVKPVATVLSAPRMPLAATAASAVRPMHDVALLHKTIAHTHLLMLCVCPRRRLCVRRRSCWWTRPAEWRLQRSMVPRGHVHRMPAHPGCSVHRAGYRLHILCKCQCNTVR